MHGSKKWLAITALIFLNLMTLNHFLVAPIDILKFTICVLFFTAIPGLLLLNFMGIYNNTGYKLALALAIGICFDIVLYMIFSVLQIKSMLYVIFGIIFMVYILKKYFYDDWGLLIKSVEGLEDGYFWLISILSVFLLALITAIYFIPNQIPGSSAAMAYFVDFPWHMGNIAEAANNWYPQDPRLSGNSFHYHIFYYLYMALIASLGNISIPILFLRLYIVFFFYLLFFAVYFAGCRWFKKRSIGIKHIVVFFFAGTCLLSWPFNIFLKNLFFSPTFLLATLLMLFLILEIKEYITAEDKGNLFIILILLFGVSGSKGSFFPVIFSGLLACFIYLLFKGQANRRLNLVLFGGLAVFSVVFMGIFRGPGSEGINMVPLEIISNTYLFERFCNLWKSAGSFPIMLGFLPVYFIAFFSFRAIAFINWSKNLLVPIGKMPIERLFISGMILASFIPGYLLSYRGSSQYYFLFVGYICLNLISAAYLDEVFSKRRPQLILLIILLLLGSFADTSLLIKNENYINSRILALKNKPLTDGLYQGLMFLKQNTDKNAVIASYRAFLFEEDPRFFYYSAFSERAMLVEGWGYMSKEYQKEALVRYEDMKRLYGTCDRDIAVMLIRKYDIDYLVVDKHNNQNFKFNKDQLLILRYRNEAVEIYQVV